MFWTRLPLLRGLIAFALLAIAFGHQPLNPGASGLQNAGADELSAYALPDGTLPVICFGDGTSGGVGDGKGRGFGAGCDACRLTGSFILPEPSCDGAKTRVLAGRRVISGVAPELTASAFSPSAPPTAPPLV